MSNSARFSAALPLFDRLIGDDLPTSADHTSSMRASAAAPADGLTLDAALALAQRRDPSAIPTLVHALRHSEPIDRARAARALGQLSQLEAHTALQAARAAESSATVLGEIKAGLASRSAADPASSAKQAVRRDLEWLLNTCRIWPEVPARFPLVKASLYNYGLRDYTGLSRDSQVHHRQLCADIKWAVETFEPRLRALHVDIVKAGTAGSDPESAGERGDERWSLRFVIEGELTVPALEKVRFETELDLAAGTFDVRDEADA